MKEQPVKLWIITGERQAGKTHFCESLVKTARMRGLKPTGILCPAGFTNGEKTSIEAREIATGKQTLLATLNRKAAQSPHAMKWDFNSEAMQWINDLLGSGDTTDLLVIDELGPLEFTLNQGWQNGLRALDEGNYKTAVVVIRPELVAQGKQRWPAAGIIEIFTGMERECENRYIASILSF